MLELWIGFYVGLFVRWGDRIQFVVAESTDRTVVGYLKQNYIRLAVRIISSAAVFYYAILPTGWVVAPPIAFSIGFSFDTMAESALDRAKKSGEAIVSKIKNGSGTPPAPTP